MSEVISYPSGLLPTNIFPGKYVLINSTSNPNLNGRYGRITKANLETSNICEVDVEDPESNVGKRSLALIPAEDLIVLNEEDIRIGDLVTVTNGEFKDFSATITDRVDSLLFTAQIGDLKDIPLSRCQITKNKKLIKNGDLVIVNDHFCDNVPATIAGCDYTQNIAHVRIQTGENNMIDHYTSMSNISPAPDPNNVGIMCICGSMKFYDDMIKVAERFTNDGWIVLLPFKHWRDNGSGNYQLTDDEEKRCEFTHKKRIEISGMITVVTRDDYIGEHTKSNIRYAKALRKNIQYVTIDYNKPNLFDTAGGSEDVK